MSEIPVYTRDEWRDYWLQCYQNRLTALDPSLTVDVGPGSVPWVRGTAFADLMLVQSNSAIAVSDSIPLDNMTLDQMIAKYGDAVPYNGDTLASGYITIGTGTAGATITIGARLVYSATNNLYAITSATDTYSNGVQLSIVSVDPGIGQNLDPGAVLQWVSTPAGAYSTVTVFSGPDGGVTGGRAAESADEYRARIREHNAANAGHGNEADVMALAELSAAHGVPVEKCFVYPAIKGPGTVSYAFTVKQDSTSKSRAPTSGQLTTVHAYLTGQGKLPGDYAVIPTAIIDQSNAVQVRVELDTRSAQWADFAPWPAFRARTTGSKVITAASGALAFTIGTDDADYTGEVAPVVGNTIGVFDATTGAFRRKKLLAVTGSGPWVVTCDSTLNQSDATYTPTVGQLVSPWCDAIVDIAVAALAHCALMGPGEATAIVPLDGIKKARQPRPYPDAWDYNLTSAIGNTITAKVPVVASCSLGATQAVAPDPGSSANVYLLKLSDLGVYKA